ncbi:MAG: hypothetical protein RQ723_06785 [Desulfuromonadales bacterium]|nr:hypothetical protein [Desulfuromonadales bacterium]
MSSTDAVEPPCRDSRQHALHICQLARKGLAAELAERTSQPAFLCHNCNRMANRAEDLCNPSPCHSPPL